MLLLFVTHKFKYERQNLCTTLHYNIRVRVPSFGIVRMGICVMEPLRPSTRPARSYIVARSVYM